MKESVRVNRWREWYVCSVRISDGGGSIWQNVYLGRFYGRYVCYGVWYWFSVDGESQRERLGWLRVEMGDTSRGCCSINCLGYEVGYDGAIIGNIFGVN